MCKDKFELESWWAKGSEKTNLAISLALTDKEAEK